jgi:hypothetical protein
MDLDALYVCGDGKMQLSRSLVHLILIGRSAEPWRKMSFAGWYSDF